jgi:nitroimidazol reductase NimA-like FMN-containing flavoprotein (pyridoxamine 5'-phosphate oxidase superfamily)
MAAVGFKCAPLDAIRGMRKDLRSMHRKDREITDPKAIEEILQKAQILRIAFSQADQPYLVPVCFAYRLGHLYFHSASVGRKMDILQQNPKVCFEAELETKIVAKETLCKWEMHYTSVIGFGTAYRVKDREEKKNALDLISRHYGAPSTEFTDREADSVSIVRIEVDQITGKQCPGNGLSIIDQRQAGS